MTNNSLETPTNSVDAAQVAGTVDIPALVARLRATYASGRTRPVQWRRKQLRGIATMMTENEELITEALSADLGRQPFEAYMEIAGTATEARYAAKNVAKWARREYHRLEFNQLPGRGWVEYEPYGTVLVIGPWNFPINLVLGPLISAVAAGNTVVLKPSELTPRSSQVLARLVPRYLDADAIAVVEGDGAVSQDLIAQGFDRLLFTGGTEIGRKVYESAASQLTPVTLELGGKSPVIVAADADIDVAAKRIAWTKLVNAGQICVAPDYILADAEIVDQLVTKIVEAIASFKADGQPIVNQKHFDRLLAALEATKGNVAVGGGSDAALRQIWPTVVVEPDRDEPLMTDEIFGPILPIVTVKSLDDAIAFVNSRPKPLAAYLFTKSKKVRERVIAEVPAGGMLINHLIFHFTTTRLPFGGVGASGIGAYHGKFGFKEFSHGKTVMTKPTRPDLGAMLYPPYTARTWKLARKLM